LDAVRSGWVSSLGKYIGRFEEAFAAYCESKHGVAVTNGTDALRITLNALGVGPGDEVIVPALTFVAVPAVVVQLGAVPVLVDVHPEYWCLDPRGLDRALNEKTRAIIAVHLYGHPADMDGLRAVVEQSAYDVPIVEDSAEAHGARYRGRRVGSLGAAGCFSFYGNKILTTGEGGMITSDDADFMARVRLLKDHAMDPERRYYHPEVGYNCRLTNLQAAMGCAQLERIDAFHKRRFALLEVYRKHLGDIEGLQLNPVMEWAEPVCWMACVVLKEADAARRDDLLLALREEGVDTRPFFVPLPDLPPYRGFRVCGLEGEDAPVSAYLGASGFNLPTSSLLEPEEGQRICEVVHRIFERH
jgi:perosamine synthetase